MYAVQTDNLCTLKDSFICCWERLIRKTYWHLVLPIMGFFHLCFKDICWICCAWSYICRSFLSAPVKALQQCYNLPEHVSLLLLHKHEPLGSTKLHLVPVNTVQPCVPTMWYSGQDIKFLNRRLSSRTAVSSVEIMDDLYPFLDTYTTCM